MGPDWKFPQPSAYHHAKFISQILYIMKYGLLGDQVWWLTDEERRQIKRMMPYAALYHGPSFLKCPLTIQAPYNDLLSYSKVREFRKVDSVMADKVLHSFSGQYWYLDESWVTISLLDDRLSKEERLLLAKTLVSIPRPESLPPVAVSNKLKYNKVIGRISGQSLGNCQVCLL